LLILSESGNFLDCGNAGLVPLSEMKRVFHPGTGRCIAARFRFRLVCAFPRVKCKCSACFEA